jgi:hypothetical protein
MSGAQFRAVFQHEAVLLQDCITCLARISTKSPYDPTWFAMVMYQYKASLCFLDNSIR